MDESTAKFVLSLVALGFTLIVLDAWARYQGWYGRRKR